MPHVVHFTFDDGPDADETPGVLERLNAAGIRATFFLLGKRIQENEALLHTMVGAGHTLGNHTFSHPRFGLFDSARQELEECQRTIEKATGIVPQVARPPYGRITPGYWIAARALGVKIRKWSLDSGDWKCRSLSDAMTCAAEVRSAMRPDDVILFHDNHRWIGPILDELLPALAVAEHCT